MAERLGAVLSVFLLSCSSPSGVDDGVRADGYEDCTAGGLLSFYVVPMDSVAPVPIPAGASLVWRAGRSTGTEYPRPSRTLPDGQRVDPTIIPGPYGRPGTFDVVVRVPGFREWQQAGIRVEQGVEHCSVREITRVEARLSRP